MEPEVVAGTSLTLVAVNSFSGSVVYRRLGLIDLRSGLLFAGAAVPGSIFAPFVVKAVAGDTFRALFGLLILGLAVQMLIRERSQLRRQDDPLLDMVPEPVPGGGSDAATSDSPSRGSMTRGSREITTRDGTVLRYDFNEALATSFNVILGFISAFFGTGGGFVRTPVLVSAFGFPVRVAVATSVFALSIYATAGSAVHALLGHVDWYPTLFWIGIGLVGGSQIGARTSVRVNSIWLLRLLVALLLLMGIRLLVQVLIE